MVTSVTSHTMDKLVPNKQYVTYVTAHIPQGSSQPSETLVVWTDPAYPAFVEVSFIYSSVPGLSFLILMRGKVGDVWANDDEF